MQRTQSGCPYSLLPSFFLYFIICQHTIVGCWIFGFASQYRSNAQPTRANLGLASLAVDHRDGHRCPGGSGQRERETEGRAHAHADTHTLASTGKHRQRRTCSSPTQRFPEVGWFPSCMVRPLPLNKLLSHPLRTWSLWQICGERRKASPSSCRARSARSDHGTKAAHVLVRTS